VIASAAASQIVTRARACGVVVPSPEKRLIGRWANALGLSSRTLRVRYAAAKVSHPCMYPAHAFSKRRDRDRIFSNYFSSKRSANTFGIGLGLWFGTINLHAPLEISAILNTDPSRCDIAAHRATPFNLDSVASTKIARQLTVHNDFTCSDVGIQLSGASYGQPSALKRDRTTNFAVDLQIFFACDRALNREGCPEQRRRAIRA